MCPDDNAGRYSGIDTRSWHDHGYCVRCGLLSEPEGLGLRKAALTLAKRFHGENFVNKQIPVDLLSHSAFRTLVLDPRLLAFARELIGPRLVYFGDSKVTVMDKRGKFHKDNGRRGLWPTDQGYDPFDLSDGPYDVLRIMVYLQDHRKFAGNLRVRKGSHKHPVPRYIVWPRDMAFWLLGRLKSFPRPPSGKRVNLNTALGDVVAFNPRTTHGVNAIRIRRFPELCLDPVIEQLVPRMLRAPETIRMAILITLGAPGVHLERFIQSRMRPNFLGNRYRNASFDSPKIRELADRAGLELRFDLVRRARDLAV